jgi:OmpA-OmpF porin, OOP family
MKQLVIAVLAAFCAIPAMAADSYYVGASVGRAEQKLSVEGVTLSENGTSGSVFGGYQFTNLIGGEIGYANLGKATVSGNGATLSAEPESVYAAVTGTWPLTAELSVFGKAGVARTHTKGTTSYNGTVESDSTNHTSAMFGVGVSYAINPKLSVFGEYQNFGKIIDETDGNLKADNLAVGLRYKF